MNISGFQEGKDYYLLFFGLKEDEENLLKKLFLSATPEEEEGEEDNSFRMDVNKEGTDNYVVKLYNVRPDIREMVKRTLGVMETSVSTIVPDNTVRFEKGRYVGMTPKEVLDIFGLSEVRNMLTLARRMDSDSQVQIYNICYCTFRERYKDISEKEVEKWTKEKCRKFFDMFSPLIRPDMKDRVRQQAGYRSWQDFVSLAGEIQLQAAVNLAIRELQ